jgi:CRP/FNR family transcriptional regulator, cyclic AMP receptor protein
MRDDGETIQSGSSVLMRALGPQTRLALLALGQRTRFAPGATIYSYGEPGASMLVIESGQVEISLTARSGRRSILNVMGPGETLGEIAMLDRHPRSADAIARTEVTGLVLHRPDVLGLLSRDPDAMLSLMAELCAKVRNASEMFAAQSNTSAAARLARCILRLGAKWGEPMADGSVRLTTTFSQSELGDFSGLARENVNRHLRSWIEEGIIVIDRDGMTLADPDALRVLAEV